MKKFILFTLTAALFCTLQTACAQRGGDKSKRPSPIDSVSATLKSGAIVKIVYSKPALKARVIGKDIEPMAGKVWRTGANEATVFEISKDVSINGKILPAGKYGFFTVNTNNEWTLIFNKKWDQWGAFGYKEAEDALRVNVLSGESKESVERLNYTIDNNGKVVLSWGTLEVIFTVK